MLVSRVIILVLLISSVVKGYVLRHDPLYGEQETKKLQRSHRLERPTPVPPTTLGLQGLHATQEQVEARDGVTVFRKKYVHGDPAGDRHAVMV